MRKRKKLEARVSALESALGMTKLAAMGLDGRPTTLTSHEPASSTRKDEALRVAAITAMVDLYLSYGEPGTRTQSGSDDPLPT